MPICAHHIEGTKYPACTDVKQVDPKCDKKCSTKAIDYNSDKVKAASSYSIRGVDSIKNDIMQYGTVTAAFTVYEDFVNYKSGVYRYVSGKELGGHAVKIIGWGKDHWICVNSWNETWGDNGLFKIAFGECGIDS
jgi:cathepsin B